MAHERVIDFDDDFQRREFIRRVSRLTGKWRFSACRFRWRRSDRQNAYYWPVVVGAFHHWLREQGHNATAEWAHSMLKHKFLRQTLVTDGEPVGEFTRSTTELDTAEFSEYVENCRNWLAEFCGLDIPDPEPGWQTEDK